MSSSSGGKITEIDVKIGDSVKSGQVLAKLDPTQAQQQVTQAQNGVTQAQLKLNQLNAPPSQVSLLNAQSTVIKAQANETNTLNNLQVLQSYKNPATLNAAITKLQISGNQGSNTQLSSLQDYANNSADLDSAIAQASIAYQIAQADLNVAKAQQTQTKTSASSTDIQLAQSQLTQAQTTLSVAQTTLNSAVITAPADGTVTAINGQIGENPSSGQGGGTNSQASSGFITMIGVSDTMQVVVPVNQVDIGKISEGLSADITLDAFSDKKFKGSVVQVSPTGTTQSGVTTFNVTINVINTDNAMKSGMSANVSIIIAQKVNVLTVPSIAVHSKGSTQTVSLAPVGEAAPIVRTVQIGLDDGKNAEVIQGLEEGDKVVTGTKAPQTKTTVTSNSLSSALSGGNTGSFGGGNGGARGNYAGGAGGSGGRPKN